MKRECDYFIWRQVITKRLAADTDPEFLLGFATELSPTSIWMGLTVKVIKIGTGSRFRFWLVAGLG
jgi:hypothetical protein